MARPRNALPGGGAALRVDVDMSDANRLPGWLERTQREWMEELGRELAAAVAEKLPGSKFDDQILSRTLSPTTLSIFTTSKAVRALDLGAYMRSRRGAGTAVRFTVGGRVRFVRWPRGTRVEARRVFRRGLRQRRAVAGELFAEKFGTGRVS